jgi:hypothetical protein
MYTGTAIGIERRVYRDIAYRESEVSTHVLLWVETEAYIQGLL